MIIDTDHFDLNHDHSRFENILEDMLSKLNEVERLAI